MPDLRRSDARRNYARILAVAEEEVRAHGTGCSFEKIAREAGVGSATVRRHFPTRESLMYAVFRSRIDGLCESARHLSVAPDSREALLTFVSEVLAYCVDARGLALAIAHDDAASSPSYGNSCAKVLAEATAPLLERAVSEGVANPRASVKDLIALVVGIALTTEGHPDPARQADCLITLVFEGVVRSAKEV